MDRVRPWGRENPRLHWFGLTDGWYWIELGDQELLRYSPDTLRRFRSDDLGPRHPYVDYYIARLWEDLIDLPPMVMQPVPDDLQRFVTAVAGVVTYEQDGCAKLEDLDGPDAAGAQEPVPHPPRAPITLHDVVRDPPHERQILVGACLARCQIRSTLGYVLERFVGERERVAVLVLEHHGVERAVAGVAGTDPDRQPSDVRVRPRRPPECVRGQLAAGADELAEGAAVHASGLGRRRLGEPTLLNPDVHPANLAESGRRVPGSRQTRPGQRQRQKMLKVTPLPARASRLPEGTSCSTCRARGRASTDALFRLLARAWTPIGSSGHHVTWRHAYSTVTAYRRRTGGPPRP